MKPAVPITHLLVALPCEAKPLVEHYRLKRRVTDQAFALYERDTLFLTVSGVGKTAMAAAVSYTYLATGANHSAVWLNVGIAGHHDAPLGTPFVAHKITDADSGRRWYPPMICAAGCASEAVVTVSRPNEHYRESGLHDMEGSGFYETATRFSTSELIQCIKIVSDNVASPASNIHPAQVSAWIADQAGLIDDLLHRLRALAEPLQTRKPPEFARFTDRWHFTVQQQRQLEQILRRWTVLAPDTLPDPASLDRMRRASEVLRWLRERVDALPVSLS